MNTPIAQQVRARPLLGTMVEIAASGAEGGVTPAIAQAFAAIAEVQALMSYQDPASDLSHINQYAFEEPVAVHAHTWQVLRAARELSEASDGLFDVTIAPTLTRLGFLPRHAHFPRASRHGDWRHVTLLSGQRVQFQRRVRIDLSGIAKGYAVDLAIRALQAAGMQAGRVNAGGDLRVFGATEQTLHVRAPQTPTLAISLGQISNGAAATSAAYFTQRRHAQRTVTPLIHPHTRTASDAACSVTVLAPDCMHADALTKIVHADPALATPILQRYQARALIVEQDAASGECRVFDSAASGACPLAGALPARSTPVGTPLLRSDPSAVPQAGERDKVSLRMFTDALSPSSLPQAGERDKVSLRETGFIAA